MNQNKTKIDISIMKEIEDMGGDLSKAARALGLNYHALKARTDTKSTPTSGVAQLARKDISRYAVAAKRSGAEWPRRYQEELDLARKSYDAGTHEIAQGRSNEWIILYVFPRLVKTKPRSYFSSQGRV